MTDETDRLKLILVASAALFAYTRVTVVTEAPRGALKN